MDISSTQQVCPDMPPQDLTSALRRTVYWFVSAIALAVMVAKIVGAENVFEPSRYAPPDAGSFGANRIDAPTRKWPDTRPDPTPAFGSNDRSRWATVEALVHHGTYVVGQRANLTTTQKPFGDSGIIFDPKTERILTLDVVMNPTTGEFYSSKPPLLATLVAAEYWLLNQALGWDLRQDRWPVMAAVLLTVNVLPFVMYLVLLAKLVEQFGKSDFGKLLIFCTGALATFVMTFSHTLNNHSPAVYCVLFACYPVLMGGSRLRLILAGLSAGFAVCFDLPSAALAAALAGWLLLTRPKFGLLFGLALLVPLFAQLACNYAALGSFTPAYAEFGGPWYNYAGSHWKKWEDVKRGVFVSGLDFNQESTTIYAFHLLLGHHGWFSLTPIFALGFFAMLRLAPSGLNETWSLVTSRWHREKPPSSALPLSVFALVVLLVSVVVLGFYLTRTQSYNYGGNTSGPRWLFWLIPLWLIVALPAADWLGRRKWGHAVAALLLGFSVLSVYYPAWNPWRSPWIMQAGERLHWWNYEADQRKEPSKR